MDSPIHRDKPWFLVEFSCNAGEGMRVSHKTWGRFLQVIRMFGTSPGEAKSNTEAPWFLLLLLWGWGGGELFRNWSHGCTVFFFFSPAGT